MNEINSITMDNGKNLIKYKIIKAINLSWKSCDLDIFCQKMKIKIKMEIKVKMKCLVNLCIQKCFEKM